MHDDAAMLGVLPPLLASLFDLGLGVHIMGRAHRAMAAEAFRVRQDRVLRSGWLAE
jgi:hypothetical protein